MPRSITGFGGKLLIASESNDGTELAMAHFDYQRVRAEVHDYCSMADFNTFDEPAIVTALRDMAYANNCSITSIDDVNPDVFVAIVEMHDTE